MNALSEKLKIMEFLLQTENEDLLRKIKSIFRTARKEKVSSPGKSNKADQPSKKIKNGNNPGFTFNWEGGLKEPGNKYDGVTSALY